MDFTLSHDVEFVLPWRGSLDNALPPSLPRIVFRFSFEEVAGSAARLSRNLVTAWPTGIKRTREMYREVDEREGENEKKDSIDDRMFLASG